jgi:hypothetical protein
MDAEDTGFVAPRSGGVTKVVSEHFYSYGYNPFFLHGNKANRFINFIFRRVTKEIKISQNLILTLNMV